MSYQWYVVYRCKPHKGVINQILDESGIEYFLPVIVKKKLNEQGDAFEEKEEAFINNLIFIRTDDNIMTLIDATDGLRCPFMDRTTNKPAVISDADMQRFKDFIQVQNLEASILEDPYQRFKVCQKVRVSAGKFAGTEGYVFRIRGDRKLVISLGNMAVAISGIHHSLLEPIEE